MFNFNYPMEEEYYDCPVPRITIPETPVLGQPHLPFEESELNRMMEIPNLLNYIDGTESPDRSQFWISYDHEALIMAGRLWKPQHGRTDIVESQDEHEQLRIILNPTPGREMGFRIRLSPGGMVDMMAGGEGAPGEWSPSGIKLLHDSGDEGWSFSLRIPYRDLGVNRPEKGSIWRMNLFRHELKRQEDNSSWSVMYLGRSDIPARYGQVAFGGDGLCAGFARCRVEPGNGEVEFSLLQREASSRKIIMEVLSGGSFLARDSKIIHEGSMTASISFNPRDGGEMLFEVKSGEGKRIAAWPLNPGFNRLLPQIEKLQCKVSELEVESRILENELAVLRNDLAILREKLEGTTHAEVWNYLEGDLIILIRNFSLLRQRAALSNPDVHWALLSTSGMEKLCPDLPLPNLLEEKMVLRAGKRGSDSGQFIILPFDSDLVNCVVEINPFLGPESEILGSESVELWRVGYVCTRKPRYTVEHVGRWPDPLLPPEPIDVKKGEQEVWWVTVNVPPNAKPGMYTSEFVVKSSGDAILKLPIELTVWDFELPVRSSLRTAFPMFEREIEEYYGREMDKDQRWAYYSFLLNRRISPSCQYETSPRPRMEDLERVMSRGGNVISMGYLKECNVEKWMKDISKYMNFLRKTGWSRWAYVYGFDEVTPPDYHKLRNGYQEVNRHYPDLPRACTIGPEHDLPKIFGTIDIWIPQIDRMGDLYEERRRAGDDLWCYVSMWPRHPFPNMFVDYPAIDHRIIFWQMWKYGISGFLYYCINLWSSNCHGQPEMDREVAALPDEKMRDEIDSGRRWPNVPWNTYTGPTATNGDGQLIYPGPNGGPLSSVRMECIRHGIEDYEMLSLLNQRVARFEGKRDFDDIAGLNEARDLLAVAEGICSGFREYTDNPAELLETRKRIGDMIVALGEMV